MSQWFRVFSKDCVKNTHVVLIKCKCLEFTCSYVKKNGLSCVIRCLFATDGTGEYRIHKDLRIVGGVDFLRKLKFGQ